MSDAPCTCVAVYLPACGNLSGILIVAFSLLYLSDADGGPLKSPPGGSEEPGQIWGDR